MNTHDKLGRRVRIIPRRHPLSATIPGAKSRSKVPSLSSTVNMERRGNRASNTLTGADGLYNGRSDSRQNQPPLRIPLKFGASAPAVVGLPLSWAILRFTGQRIWLARLRRLFQCRSVCNSERSAGERGRARGELKTVRLGGARHENASSGVKGEKAFWCHGGEPVPFGRDKSGQKLPLA
jgi:hypothetical protein